MGRPPRCLKSDAIYHVFNRSAGKRQIFLTDEDYSVFGEAVKKAQTRVPMRVLAFCLMPNHWHLVVWPLRNYSLSDFMHRLTTKHAKQNNVDYGLAGCGHVYQERFRSVEVESDRQLLTVLRYVEANARNAGLVTRAEDWKWSSACPNRDILRTPTIDTWPIPRPVDWLKILNQGESPTGDWLRDDRSGLRQL
jgi:putative transposase